MSAQAVNIVFDRYIDALLSLSNDSAKISLWLAQGTAFSATLQDSETLARAFGDPRVSKTQKEAVMLDIAKAMGLDQNLTRMLAIFIRQGRGHAMKGLCVRLTGRLKKELGVVVADVISASALSASQEQELAQSLGKQVELNTKIDPELLGGMVVQIGSWRMDDSVKGKLDRLTRRLKSAA